MTKLTRNTEFDNQPTSQIAATSAISVRSSPWSEESGIGGKIPFCYVTNQPDVGRQHLRPLTSRVTVSAAVVKRV